LAVVGGPLKRRSRTSLAVAISSIWVGDDGPAGAIPATITRVRIEQAIWATRDLEAATAHFAREHGLAASGGGRHDGMGTRNRIVPLRGRRLPRAARDRGRGRGEPALLAVGAGDRQLR
jgi:hypothetical protein